MHAAVHAWTHASHASEAPSAAAMYNTSRKVEEERDEEGGERERGEKQEEEE